MWTSTNKGFWLWREIWEYLKIIEWADAFCYDYVRDLVILDYGLVLRNKELQKIKIEVDYEKLSQFDDFEKQVDNKARIHKVISWNLKKSH